MRAVTYVKNNTVEVREKPTPEIEPDQVLLRVGGAGVCHSDISIIGMGDENPLIGSTLGHEVAGTIEQLGANVTGWEVGQRAIVALILSCGQCRECLAGRDNQCEVVAPRGSLAPLSPGIGSPGGMADYIAVRAHHLDPIGELDPVAAAPLADAALTPMHAINTVRDRLSGDATVVTIGLGGLGHMALQILAATTGARIIALDTDPEKLAFAEAHGADLAIPSDGEAAARILAETGGVGADVVFDFVGVQPTVDLALAVVRGGGAIRFVGLGGGSFTYTAGNSALPWGVNIERAYGGTRADMRQVVALAQAGKIGVEVVRYGLDDAVQAFDDLHHGRIAGRAVLVP
ncbi:alcohol dehydrogenase catalytic domain-containing protein [Leucobacter chromiireducens]|uniref:NAD(P)-dependent alcohol dehydrogenase n=1 Tax=Leucobacter chromiireducens subsp. chromiireducens TaxID=660067 RepID=A0ABS1SS00_9MICO|nr:alcohol dehydrogenase catalytic domain-containing protein [Leucobacter chromiireducens]MBL3690410.1 NAD(P)-dependent alcohol dehydrogenase [Leucobacter chromiireducens subsp. chromiireducens]